jgi:hypothetical protein
MKTKAGAKRRRRLAAMAVLLVALVASLAVAVGSAAAEEGDSAEIRDISEGGLSFPEIKGPEAPEEYPLRLSLGSEQAARQVSDQEVIVEYPKYGLTAFSLHAEPAHDAEGATVPTAIKLTEDEEGPILTLIIHYRAGNPAAGGAPFVYPILGGTGWEGGYHSYSFEMNEPLPPVSSPPPPAPVPTCTVPPLGRLTLRAAKARLRGADCGVGKVRLAPGATQGKGKVVKQFGTVGAQLPAGAPITIKLGGR